MGRRAELSVETRIFIVALHEKGHSQSTVIGALQRKRESGCNTSRHHGRLKATSKQEDKFI